MESRSLYIYMYNFFLFFLSVYFLTELCNVKNSNLTKPIYTQLYDFK